MEADKLPKEKSITTLKTKKESYSVILSSLDEIKNKLNDMDQVHITNGGGRHISYPRDEFFQMLYDRGVPSKYGEKLLKYILPILIILQIIQIAIGK
ncbi:MAG: hypothetical protein M1480_18690 [Bacteroidetes bacterium]|nr:hypothetical protein [Bacteroidota bacterium]